MDLSSSSFSPQIFTIFSFLFFNGILGATFTFINNCNYTVWPGIRGNSAAPRLETTGFELPKGRSLSIQKPTGWSGHLWGRTGCNFSGSGEGVCSTGDCGSGEVECKGLEATSPATLAEFSLGSVGQDFYDVSLLNGYNLPLVLEGRGGTGTCAAVGCVTDLNRKCPAELRVGKGDACKSPCKAFGSPEYCCSGAYSTPKTCKPSVYSAMFKSACPKAYSYAFDDDTSLFTCTTGADYAVTFCPSNTNRQKSTETTPIPPMKPLPIPPTKPPPNMESGSGSGSDKGMGSSVSYAGTGMGTIRRSSSSFTSIGVLASPAFMFWLFRL